jgi:DNA-binding beta-propeller fold protein YncE
VLGVAAAIALLVGLVAYIRGDDTPALTAIAPNSVGVIDPDSNRLVAEIPVGQSPKGAVAGDGAVWVVNSGDATLTRIDAARRLVLKTIPLPGAPSDAALSESVWVLHNRGSSFVDPFAGSATLTEINPHFDSVARTIDIPAGFGNSYEDPIAAASGALWVAGPTGVSKIDAKSGRVHPRLPVSEVTDLVANKGSVWAVEWFGAIVRIDRSGDFVAESVSLSSTTSTLAAAAGFGSLWVVGKPSSARKGTDKRRTSSLFRVDPRNGELSAKIRLPGAPAAIAVGGGAVWVADAERQQVLRVDPATNRVVTEIALGARPTSIVVDDQAVWVTVT